MAHTAAGLIQREHIAKARSAINPYIRRTPVIEIQGSDVNLRNDLTLKLELLQHTGSFKARGAFTNLLLRSVPPAGVVAASGGNHGAAVAYAAMRLGVSARIYIPRMASPAAAAFAALLKGKYHPLSGERVGLIVSGGNTVAVDFRRQEKVGGEVA